MKALVHDTTGLIHLAASCTSLLFGTLILLWHKGTRLHKRIGYAYTFSMVILNATAFGLYHLFGRFGAFHIAALISSLTIIAGMIPVMLKRPTTKWLDFHMAFMYYSVIGLYAAFASEIITRVILSNFGVMVSIATGLVMGLGAFFFQVKRGRWRKLVKQ